jgi:hypothetical protein
MDLGEQSRGGRDESLTAISKDRVEQADVGNKHPATIARMSKAR